MRRNIVTRAAHVETRKEAKRIKKKAKKQAWQKIGDELEKDLQGTRKLLYRIKK